VAAPDHEGHRNPRSHCRKHVAATAVKTNLEPHGHYMARTRFPNNLDSTDIAAREVYEAEETAAYAREDDLYVPLHRGAGGGGVRGAGGHC
jgi:hypothetical protein